MWQAAKLTKLTKLNQVTLYVQRVASSSVAVGDAGVSTHLKSQYIVTM
jgi:hypothetical protein